MIYIYNLSILSSEDDRLGWIVEGLDSGNDLESVFFGRLVALTVQELSALVGVEEGVNVFEDSFESSINLQGFKNSQACKDGIELRTVSNLFARLLKS